MIHPSAVIDATAELAADIDIGPFAVIGAQVRIGRGCRIGPHAVLRGPTEIGEDNWIFQFASVGEIPQDKKYGGEDTRLVIGDRNVIREFVTIHRGTMQDQGVTRIGCDNLFMAYTHVAHDCRVGNHIIMANAASIGGHVEVQDWAILGAFTLVHQFCRIGAHCFTAMGSIIRQDVPPFILVAGHPAVPRGINLEGLRRRDFAPERVRAIQRAYRLLYRSNLRSEEALAAIRKLAVQYPDLALMADFVSQSSRGILRA